MSAAPDAATITAGRAVILAAVAVLLNAATSVGMHYCSALANIVCVPSVR
jgi:hypothetical protein